MAFIGRHDRLLLRFGAAVTLVTVAMCAAPVRAQVGAPGRARGVTSLPSATRAPTAPHQHVQDIRIIGNRTISREKVLANMGTKINQPFDQATFGRDVRKLVGKSWFVHVEPYTQRVPGGIVITLRVVERPTLEYVRYLGWKKIKPKTLAKKTNLKKGDSLDPFAVEEGARKIETFYQTKGFNDVKVEVLEGNKPSDKGAIYLINEGTIQKIKKVRFEGNTIASDGRLKTQIQSKPPLFWIFKGFVDRNKIEEDVDSLTAYYRNLGYFKALVGRDYVWNDEEDRMTLTYFINEGPRYKVRDVSFLGNSIYDSEALASGLKLKSGDFYDGTKMAADVGYIKDVYGANGYVFADAQAELRFDIEPGPLDIAYTVTEGEQCLVGDIRIHIGGDNPHTRTLTALNRASFRPGDVIDIRKIRATEVRIKRSGLFNVDPTKGPVPRIELSPLDPEDDSDRETTIARQQGGSDGVRGQSLDPPPPSRRTTRSQSPDGGYGGYAVNDISPEPNPYMVHQQPSGYPAPPPNRYPPANSTTQPLPGGYTVPPPRGYSTQPPIRGAPPAGVIYDPNAAPPQGNFAQSPGYPPGFGAGPPDVPGGLMFPGPSGNPLLDDRPRIPVDIYLNEAQTGRFMFGAGVNSNAGLVGSVILDEQNFDWRRFPTSWEDFRSGRAFRGAGQKFRVEAAPGTEVSRYMFSFADPYLFDTRVSFGLSAFYFQRFYRDWNEQRTGGRTSLGWQFSPDLSGNLAMRIEDVLISDPRVLGVAPLDEALGHTQMYALTGTVAWDTRDNTFLPTEGHYVSLSAGYTQGTFQYPTYTVDFRKFFMLRQRPDGSGRHVLSMYNLFGITGSDTPIYQRFFAGGFSTLRGFQFRGASPQINTVQVGGDFQNLTSFEYMFPLTADDMLRAVVFVDFGTVEQSVTINWDQFRVAPGAGLRISLPALGPAPIAIDFAVPVLMADTDIRQLVNFFVGYAR